MTTGSHRISQSLLPEFDLEMANTRRVLERVPDAEWAFKPHPKSFSMGELAGHVATIAGWMTTTLTADVFDVAPGGAPAEFPKPSSTKEALAFHDEGVASARPALEAATDGLFLSSWSLAENGKTLFTMPRVSVARSFVMNHLIHHRAQLCVYLRLKDVPVPALYGPSADES